MIPPVSSPLSRLETESPMDSLSQSSSVAAVDTNSGWETPPPFRSSSFPSVEWGDELPFGSVLSTPEFLPSPASSQTTTLNKVKSPLGETDLRNKLNNKQGVVLKSSETDPSPAKAPSTKLKAGRAKGQSLSRGKSSMADDVISKDEVARSPKAVAELIDTQPSQETSLTLV